MVDVLKVVSHPKHVKKEIVIILFSFTKYLSLLQNILLLVRTEMSYRRRKETWVCSLPLPSEYWGYRHGPPQLAYSDCLDWCGISVLNTKYTQIYKAYQ